MARSVFRCFNENVGRFRSFFKTQTDTNRNRNRTLLGRFLGWFFGETSYIKQNENGTVGSSIFHRKRRGRFPSFFSKQNQKQIETEHFPVGFSVGFSVENKRGQYWRMLRFKTGVSPNFAEAPRDKIMRLKLKLCMPHPTTDFEQLIACKQS